MTQSTLPVATRTYMSEDVPIYLDRGQKSSSDSHDEKVERKRKFFTEEENEALRRGLQRYGQGKWTRILKDSEFSALQGRTIDSLKKRASSKGFRTKFSTINETIAYDYSRLLIFFLL